MTEHDRTARGHRIAYALLGLVIRDARSGAPATTSLATYWPLRRDSSSHLFGTFWMRPFRPRPLISP